uniref:C2H2-type domain-containing protein n=1 Tax=Cynoglossus semilaevis TaxID=244447 RepID=A0A3P8WXU5_CYNSE
MTDSLRHLVDPPVSGRGDGVSPGRAEESAGPSALDTPVDPSGDRPHHCLECGKTFQSGALKTHLRIHTGEKPYSCSECGNSFRHLDGLRKHRRTHTGEKPYVCAICGKRLSRLQHLKHHQLIHTGERPCCCPFCSRSFKEPVQILISTNMLPECLLSAVVFRPSCLFLCCSARLLQCVILRFRGGSNYAASKVLVGCFMSNLQFICIV